MADPSSRQLLATGLQMADADLPINKGPTSLCEVREAMTRLRGEKTSVFVASMRSCSKLR